MKTKKSGDQAWHGPTHVKVYVPLLVVPAVAREALDLVHHALLHVVHVRLHLGEVGRDARAEDAHGQERRVQTVVDRHCRHRHTALRQSHIRTGICTMLCSESTPSSVLPFTGTPITGTGVCAATMPGRCAAPPAPAMMMRTPRAGALRA